MSPWDLAWSPHGGGAVSPATRWGVARTGHGCSGWLVTGLTPPALTDAPSWRQPPLGLQLSAHPREAPPGRAVPCSQAWGLPNPGAPRSTVPNGLPCPRVATCGGRRTQFVAVGHFEPSLTVNFSKQAARCMTQSCRPRPAPRQSPARRCPGEGTVRPPARDAPAGAVAARDPQSGAQSQLERRPRLTGGGSGRAAPPSAGHPRAALGWS